MGTRAKGKTGGAPAKGEGMARTLLARGRECASRGDYEGAVRYFDEALRRQPRLAEAYADRGAAWHYLGEYRSAIADYDAALRLTPALGGTVRNRGAARASLQDRAGAIADYTKALKIDARDRFALQLRAQAFADEQEHAAAIRDLTALLRLAPDMAPAYLARARAWRALGRPRHALADLSRAIEHDPLSEDAYEARRTVREELGDAAGAQADAGRLRELLGRSALGLARTPARSLIAPLIAGHFGPADVSRLSITRREFPYRVRADLRRAIDAMLAGKVAVRHFSGVQQGYAHEGLNLAELVVQNAHQPAVSAPPEYEEVDVGDPEPVRCLKNSLWLAERGEVRFALLLSQAVRFGHAGGLGIQLAVAGSPEAARFAGDFFKQLEEAVLQSRSYRGKVLSLEQRGDYTGQSTGILVHRLREVRREDVILPRRTLELLDRNVTGFARQREHLARFGLSTRKGILFYGPPGTGKTHTIHYLIRELKGATTFLITAGQMGLLGDYMALARLLQPSIVVIEDVDLIARDRETLGDACSESLLNTLLNEMDGLAPDAEILFIMTTNRPESLEAALASRPGRIDQAIEYPLPDGEGREKLIRLYSKGLTVPDEVIRDTVARTRGVSASFIRELMRRTAQFHLEAGKTSGRIDVEDVAAALDEMLVSGGSLNRKLLGAHEPEPGVEV